MPQPAALARTDEPSIHDVIDLAGARDRAPTKLVSPSEPNVGGADRDRTDDLKLAKLPLSQLSYGPELEFWKEAVVGPDRFELSTPRLSSVCSNQLSYGPAPAAVRATPKFEARAPQLARKLSRITRIATLESFEEKRNEDGDEPQISQSSVNGRGTLFPSRSRGSACADIQSKSSLERR